MTKEPRPNGRLLRYTFNYPLPDGYYQYQYLVRFTGGSARVVLLRCHSLMTDRISLGVIPY